MKVKLNLGEWNSIFAVPSALVDKHIKLAGGSQIKVLLCILRHAGKNIDLEYISKLLAMHPADVRDALQYWIEVGLLTNTDTGISPVGINIEENSTSKNEEEQIRNKPSVVRRFKPDSKYINNRLDKDKQIAFLMQEAQVILGRPISQGDLAILIMIHDNEGLPIDVIIMLLQYAVSIGKGNMNYIEKIANTWASEEIDSIKKAEKKIKLLSANAKAWIKVIKIMGIEQRSPTAKENEQVNRWINEYHISDEVLKEAYDICITRKGKLIMNYIDTIIKKWYNSGIRNLSDINNEKNNRSVMRKNSNQRAAYDINEYDNLSAFD